MPLSRSSIYASCAQVALCRPAQCLVFLCLYLLGQCSLLLSMNRAAAMEDLFWR